MLLAKLFGLAALAALCARGQEVIAPEIALPSEAAPVASQPPLNSAPAPVQDRLFFPPISPGPPQDPKYNWANWGNGIYNDRWARYETKINASNAGRLMKKRGWPIRVYGDTSATPTVVNGTVYIVDWGFPDYSHGGRFVGDGHLTAVTASTGAIMWTRQIMNYTGIPSMSRSSPAIHGDILVIGAIRQGYFGILPKADSTFSLGINATTGDLLWKTMVDGHPYATITMSPTIYDGAVFIGISSVEEVLQDTSCCSFQGSAQKLDLYTGKVLWRFETMPPGYYGGAIWSSSPPIDVQRNLVFFSTGNNYLVPPAVNECFAKNIGNYTAQSTCDDPPKNQNSILALDQDTGKLRWARRLGTADVWILACSPVPIVAPYADCPGFGEIKDWDFGQSPIFITGKNGRQDLLVIGQKSSMVWGLSPETGSIIWMTDTFGRGISGGMLFGSASDGERIYVSNSNSGNDTVEMINPPPGASKTAAGAFTTALDLDGRVLWEFANPVLGLNLVRLLSGKWPFRTNQGGPVSVANGVVFVPSMDPFGDLFYLNAKTGQELGRFATGIPIGALACGPAIVDGVVYVGSGYAQQALPSLFWHVYALTLPELSGW